MVKQIIFTIPFFLYSSALLAEAAVAKVIKTEGVSSAINAQTQSRTLNRGDDIYISDTVQTSGNGFVTMRFTDGTVVDLAHNSRYIVKDYNYNPSEPKTNHFDSELIEGGFRAITGKVATSNPSGYTNKARLTTLTVRGTYYYLMAPACKTEKTQEAAKACNDVLQFTVEGVTAITINGQTYELGTGKSNTTFDYAGGSVSMSNKIPSQLPVSFSSDVNGFLGSLGGAGGVPGSSTSAPGGAGGGTSPCGTLNAVGGALPK